MNGWLGSSSTQVNLFVDTMLCHHLVLLGISKLTSLLGEARRNTMSKTVPTYYLVIQTSSPVQQNQNFPVSLSSFF
mgnify:CR=1 FL=1